MIASLVSSRFVFSFRPWGQAWPEEEVTSRLRLSPKVSSPAMGMGAVAAFHYAEERRPVCRPAYTRNPIRRQIEPGIAADPGEDALAEPNSPWGALS